MQIFLISCTDLWYFFIQPEYKSVGVFNVYFCVLLDREKICKIEMIILICGSLKRDNLFHVVMHLGYSISRSL